MTSIPSGTATNKPSSAHTPIAERVRDRTIGPCRLLTLSSPVENVVSWRGSFRTYPDFERGDELLQSLTVSLLDKGTRRRDRFALAELVENRGAQVHFSSDGLLVECSGRALRADAAEMMTLVGEQLREPAFDEAEFSKAKARAAASLRRSLDETSAQASGALSRRIYPRAHPNYVIDAEEQLEVLETLTVDDIRTYHQRHFGAAELTFVVVGDFDEAVLEAAIEEAFAGWEPAAVEARFARAALPQTPGRTTVSMPDKNNVDVRIGQPVSVLRQDEDYLPLYLGNYVLGGNFSARLMTVIRDEMGLTYGIRSGLAGITNDYQGHWFVAVTLSQENIDRGVEATLAEVRRFVEDGVTEAELADKKATMTGAFQVGLATTGGLASALLTNVERGFDVAYLDRFVSEVNATSLSAVNDAIRRHLDPEQFHLSLAGHLP